MKIGTFIIIACLMFYVRPGVSAEESVYTWTDAQGVLTISNRPPKDEVNVQAVDRYQVPRHDGVKKIPAETVNTAAPIKGAVERKSASEAAQKEAERARALAEEYRQKATAFKQKVGLKKNRLRKNRSKIKKLEEQAEQAEKQADLAEEKVRSVSGQ